MRHIKKSDEILDRSQEERELDGVIVKVGVCLIIYLFGCP